MRNLIFVGLKSVYNYQNIRQFGFVGVSTNERINYLNQLHNNTHPIKT